MGRKEKEEKKRKELITIRISNELIKEIKKIKNYNVIIGKLIEKYLKDNDYL